MDKITITEAGYDGGGYMQYHLKVDGVKQSLIYYNMGGYCVERGIPVPHEGGSIGLTLREGSMTIIRREVKKANREWKTLSSRKQ